MDVFMPYFQTTPELTLLLCLMQGETNLCPEADCERLDALIRKNRMEPLAAARLTGERMPDFFHDEEAVLTMRQISALGRLANRFAEQGIRVISVKGPALAMEIFDTPGLRCYHDLDLLVEVSEVERAVELLTGDGWTWYERDVLTTPKRRKESLRVQNHYLFVKGEVCVELHWRLLPWDCDIFECLWAESRRIRLGGAEFAVLGAVHQLHHLVHHGARHGFHRMKWLADLTVLLPRHTGEMDALWNSLAQSGQEVCLLMTWTLMLRLQALDVPDVSFAGFTLHRTKDGVLIQGPENTDALLKQTESILETLIPMLENAEDTEHTAQHRKYRKMLKGPKWFRTILHDTVERFRPQACVWRWVNLPDRLYWLYWILRPMEKLWRYIKNSKT